MTPDQLTNHAESWIDATCAIVLFLCVKITPVIGGLAGLVSLFKGHTRKIEQDAINTANADKILSNMKQISTTRSDLTSLAGSAVKQEALPALVAGTAPLLAPGELKSASYSTAVTDDQSQVTPTPLDKTIVMTKDQLGASSFEERSSQ